MPIGIPLAWQNRPELLRLHCPEGAAFCFDCFRAAANVFVGIRAGIVEVQ